MSNIEIYIIFSLSFSFYFFFLLAVRTSSSKVSRSNELTCGKKIKASSFIFPFNLERSASNAFASQIMRYLYAFHACFRYFDLSDQRERGESFICLWRIMLIAMHVHLQAFHRMQIENTVILYSKIWISCMHGVYILWVLWNYHLL